MQRRCPSRRAPTPTAANRASSPTINDASLEAVEEIPHRDISRLDAGFMKAEIGPLRLDDIFSQLQIELRRWRRLRAGPSLVRSSPSVRRSPVLRRLCRTSFQTPSVHATGASSLARARKGDRVRLRSGTPASASRGKPRRRVSRIRAASNCPAQRAGLGLWTVDRRASCARAGSRSRPRLTRGIRLWCSMSTTLAPAT